MSHKQPITQKTYIPGPETAGGLPIGSPEAAAAIARVRAMMAVDGGTRNGIQITSKAKRQMLERKERARRLAAGDE